MPQQPSSVVPAVVPLSLGLAKTLAKDHRLSILPYTFRKNRVLRLTELRVAQEINR